MNARRKLALLALLLGASMIGCAGGDPEDAGPEAEEPSAGPPVRPPSITLSRGERGPEVTAAHRFLKAFGYFPSARFQQYPGWKPVSRDPSDLEAYGPELAAAVTRYQRNQGLSETGAIDAATLAVMRLPRCGFPDNVEELAEPGAAARQPLASAAAGWGQTDLRYRILDYSADSTSAEQHGVVAAAMATWADASGPLSLTEGTSAQLTLTLGVHLAHDKPFDGAGGVLAHAQPPGVGNLSGGVHMDDAELWSAQPPTPSGAHDLRAVVLHEIGHALGLSHSSSPQSVMYASYGGMKWILSPEDIDSIRAIYGR